MNKQEEEQYNKEVDRAIEAIQRGILEYEPDPMAELANATASSFNWRCGAVVHTSTGSF